MGRLHCCLPTAAHVPPFLPVGQNFRNLDQCMVITSPSLSPSLSSLPPHCPSLAASAQRSPNQDVQLSLSPCPLWWMKAWHLRSAAHYVLWERGRGTPGGNEEFFERSCMPFISSNQNMHLPQPSSNCWAVLWMPWCSPLPLWSLLMAEFQTFSEGRAGERQEPVYVALLPCEEGCCFSRLGFPILHLFSQKSSPTLYYAVAVGDRIRNKTGLVTAFMELRV